MRHVLYGAAAAFAVMVSSAAMAEGDLAAVEAPPMARPIVGGGFAAGGAGEAYPSLSAISSAPITSGINAVLPPSGGEGIWQTAASLPRGFADPAVARMQAKSAPQHMAGNK